MSDPVRWSGQVPPMRGQQQAAPQGDGTNLADILERVLDKGIVIAGDVQVNLLDIELLTIKLRLVVASVDRAKEMGIDWWERDPTLSSGHRELEDENRRLRERLEALEGRTNGHGPLPAGDDDEPYEDADDIDDAEEIDDEIDADDADADDIDEAEEIDAEEIDADDAEPAADETDEDTDDTPVQDEPEPRPARAARTTRRRS